MTINNATQLLELLHGWSEKRVVRQGSKEQREEVCLTLADHFLKHLVFLPDTAAFRSTIHTFTGERLDSATRRSYVTMECLRLLTLFDDGVQMVREARRAAESMALCEALVFKERFWSGLKRGMYCCGGCTPAFWRMLTAGGFERIDRGAWEKEGLAALRARRLAGGQWRQFPFFYTLLALSEMRSPAAREEKRFVAKRCEEFLKSGGGRSFWQARRRGVVEVILGQV